MVGDRGCTVLRKRGPRIERDGVESVSVLESEGIVFAEFQIMAVGSLADNFVDYCLRSPTVTLCHRLPLRPANK